MKKCKVCGEPFTPSFTSFQKTCTKTECLVAFGRGERTRIYKAQRKEARKNRSYYLKKVQVEFNKFIRNRDSAEPCISCQRHHSGQYHAGHYRSVGGHSSILRYHESNCHKQCMPCNTHLSGNLVEFRVNLLVKIGADKVEWLEGPHPPFKYTIDDLQALLTKYKTLNKNSPTVDDWVKKNEE